MKCVECGKTLKKGKGNYKYLESGLDNILLMDIPNYTCTSCKEQEWEVPCSEELHLMIAFLLVLKPNHLIGKEARFLRKHLGYTAEDWANVLGVKRVAVTRWETGESKITGSNDKSMRRVYLDKKRVEIMKTPGIMRIVTSLIDFISLDNKPAKEVKIRKEDWSECVV